MSEQNRKLQQALEEYLVLLEGGCTRKTFMAFLSKQDKAGVDLMKLMKRIRLHGHSPSFVTLPTTSGPIEITATIPELTCSEAMALVDNMSDSIIGDNDFAALAIHLDKCPGCEGLYQDLQKLR